MSSLTQCDKQQLTQIVRRITQCAPVEKLYLHSIRYEHQYGVSVFSGITGNPQRVQQYHFLVLVAHGPDHIVNALQDKIEAACHAITPVTACVLSMRQFNDWLASGYSFAYSIYHHALLCFDADTIPFTQPGRYNHPSAKEFKPWRKRAIAFLEGAKQYIDRKEYAMAAFMLHQSAEQSLIALIMQATGYRAPWHKMERLFGMALSVNEGVFELFPRDTEKEELLFRLLQNAYTQPRYRNDYTISETEIKTLHSRVERLIELAQPVRQELEVMLVTPERINMK